MVNFCLDYAHILYLCNATKLFLRKSNNRSNEDKKIATYCSLDGIVPTPCTISIRQAILKCPKELSNVCQKNAFSSGKTNALCACPVESLKRLEKSVRDQVFVCSLFMMKQLIEECACVHDPYFLILSVCSISYLIVPLLIQILIYLYTWLHKWLWLEVSALQLTNA